jgi:uncharacterized protein YjbI with pentapeptide repeats
MFQSSLAKANLSGANLQGAKLAEVSFRGVDLTNSSFKDAEMTNTEVNILKSEYLPALFLRVLNPVLCYYA